MARDRWTALPTDILVLLLSIVSFHDLVRLTALCKTWWQPALDDLRRRHRNQPWLISSDHGRLDLCDPWLNTSYSLLKTIRQDDVKELLLGTDVHASKIGWLLMSKEAGSGIISFLFYNPLRNEIINSLPPLDLKADSHVSSAMFSTTPTSPDCVIFVLSIVIARGKQVIISYRLSTYKDKKWNTIPTRKGWGGSRVRDVIYIDGKFYCMFNLDYGLHVKLGIFNVAHGEWSTEFITLRSLMGGMAELITSKSLIELDGEVLLAIAYGDRCKILQFDRSKKSWKRIKSLGDRVLFMNHRSGSSSSMVAVGEAKELANMIVRLDLVSGNIMTYACEDDQGEWTLHQTSLWHCMSQ